MRKRLLSILIALLFLLTACTGTTVSENTVNYKTDSSLELHFIDVGQGDCILVLSENTSMLIDAGTKESGHKITEYIKSLGIESLDYFIGTHPHDDHLGGAAKVIREFSPKEVLMSDELSDAYFYEELLETLYKENISVTVPEIGCRYREEDFDFKFISPYESFGDTNDNSLVMMIYFKNTNMLFMGDAEKSVEEKLLEEEELKADVLKVGHHGSRYASNYDFLRAVEPTVAVIQSEKGNMYGHPHEEAIERLGEVGANILRCDELGTIVLKCDGEKIYYNEEELIKKEVITQISYIGNKKSHVFHRDTCGNLPKESNSVKLNSREEAIILGYSACKGCNP
ncbi:MAG: MBL fold metallo-hydrolase [Clostridia bacterium]|nr:MBL fold metallo-hydrolase [Clostridia bacterium]